MKNEIRAWLESPRIYTEGLALYDKYGVNKVLKQKFLHGIPESMSQILEYELAKLAGISENELKQIQRKEKAEKPKTATVVSKPVFVDDVLLELAGKLGFSVKDLFESDEVASDFSDDEKEIVEKLKVEYVKLPTVSKETLKFRERYPFLSHPECPDELKIMVSDMFAAYDLYRIAYNQLGEEKSQDENLANAQAVVENYLANKQMWDELDYYKENGKVLGEHPLLQELKLKDEIKAMTDLELPKKVANAKSNITRSNTAVDKADTDEKLAKAQERLAHWNNYLELLEKEIAKRSK